MKQRTILWYLVFVGFSVNYMIRINVNIAIVDMLSSRYGAMKPATVNSSVSECFARNSTAFQDVNATASTLMHHEKSTKFPSLERKILDSLGVSWHSMSHKFPALISYQSVVACHTVDMTTRIVINPE